MTAQAGSLAVFKSVFPALSKIGDSVQFTIEICNRGETTLYRVQVLDSMFGDLSAMFPEALSPGQCFEWSKTYIIQPGDPDPLINHVMAVYRADLTASASATINLFQPSVQIIKTGPAISKVGDIVSYLFEITNTSSDDSPPLLLDQVTDTVLGDLTSDAKLNGCSVLAPSGSCQFTVHHQITASDPDPFTNIVTATYHPDGYPNIIQASASHTVDLVHPSFTVTKSCQDDFAAAGGIATFDIAISNTGDVPLNIQAVDQGQYFYAPGLVPGTTFSFSVQVPVPSPVSGQCIYEVSNTVDVTATLNGLPNILTQSATATCPVANFGKTRGFWGNRNGNAVLDPDGNGLINQPVVLGGDSRTVSVTTIVQSNEILRGNFCSLSGSQCDSLSDALNPGTLATLIAQTLTLQYNIMLIPCYSGQTVRNLGCTQEAIDAGISPDATVNEVLLSANSLIANSTSGGTTTQSQAGTMNALLGCLNRETA